MATRFSETDIRGMGGEQNNELSQEVVTTIIELSELAPLLAPLLVHCAINSFESVEEPTGDMVVEIALSFLCLYSVLMKIEVAVGIICHLDFDTIIYCLVLGQNSLILTRCIMANVIASIPNDQSKDFPMRLIADVTHANSHTPGEHI